MKKADIHKECVDKLNTQIHSLEQSLARVIESRDNESKSSVGDKYETGRAMMHMEQEKLSHQLNNAKEQLALLNKLSFQNTATIRLGSFIETSIGNFYLAVAIGKLNVEDQSVFVISPRSPIGQLLMGKKENDTIFFNKKITIQKIH